MNSFSDFISELIGARFSFSYLWQQLSSLYESVVSDGAVLSIWDWLKNLSTGLWTALPYILMALGVIVLLFGKKMGGFVKFVGFFIVGFFLGVYFLASVIPPEVPIAPWVVGIVVAILAAVLSKMLFVTAYSVIVLYSVYRLCYHGFFFDNQQLFSVGKSLTALAVAAIVLVLTLIFFRFVQMLVFSVLGAWMITSGFAFGIIDLDAIPKLGANSWILEVTIMGIIAILGFIFQIKTRKRY